MAHFSSPHRKVFAKATKNIINMKRRANLNFCGASDNISINYAVLSFLRRRAPLACMRVLENSGKTESELGAHLCTRPAKERENKT
jgi:hypothetical protein